MNGDIGEVHDLDELTAANEATLSKLAGQGVTVPPEAMHRVQVIVYLEELLAERGLLTDARLRFQVIVAEQLDAAQKNVARAKLMAK